MTDRRTTEVLLTLRTDFTVLGFFSAKQAAGSDRLISQQIDECEEDAQSNQQVEKSEGGSPR